MTERSIVVRLRAEVTDFKRSMSEAAMATDKTSAAFDKNGQKINTTAGRMVRSAEINREAWNTAGASLTAFGVAGVAALGLTAKAAIEWESAWAGVLKTVDGTSEQLASIESGLRALTTELPASHREIAAVAEAAGQLGVQTDQIVAFTKVMIDLGETTNLSSEEAATSLARFMNVMGTSQSEVHRLGSALVGLGNNYATTEAEIMAMAMRLSGAGRQIKLSEGQVVGLAAAMSSVGIEAEAGGSAMSLTMKRIEAAVDEGGESVMAFAEVAGMSASNFQKAWKEDAAGALSAFVMGLDAASARGESVNGILKDLGISGIRESDALLRLSAAGTLMFDAMTQGVTEYTDATALIEEANKRYETTEAKIQMAKNAINDAAITIGEDLLPALVSMAEWVAKGAAAFASLPDPARQTIAGLGGVASVAALVGGSFLLIAPRVMDTVKAFRLLGEVAPRVASTVRVASASMGVIAAAATIAIGVMAAFASKNAEARREAQALAETLDETTGAISDMTREQVYNSLVTSGITEDAKLLGIGLDLLTDAALGNADAIAEVREQTERAASAVEAAHDPYRDYTDAEYEVLGAANLVNKAVGEQAEVVAHAREAWADKQVALLGTSDATKGVTSLTKQATEATLTYTESILGSIDALRESAGLALTESESLIRYKDAVEDATEALGDNGATLDINTDAGRRNQEALNRLTDSTWDWVESGAEAGLSVEELAARMQEGRDALRATAEQMGLTEDEARRLADSFGLIPAQVTTNVAVSGYTETYNQLTNIQSRLQSISGNSNLRIAMGYGSTSQLTYRANGGGVFGPGTGTSDSIPAWLSNGEHVWTAREVAAAGGHGAVEALRQAVVRGYASGGAVSAAPVVSVAVPNVNVPAIDYDRLAVAMMHASVAATDTRIGQVAREIGQARRQGVGAAAS